MAREKLIKSLFLAVISTIVVLLLFELALFLSGELYYASRLKNTVKIGLDKNIVKILCLGDSFTFGMGARKEYAYPKQLERRLNENKFENKKYVVFNVGVPGNTSSKLLNHLEEDLQAFSPDIIIVLIGMNDRFCIEETNYFLFKHKGLINRLLYYLSGTRVYKLFKRFVSTLEIRVWEDRLKKTYRTDPVCEPFKSREKGLSVDTAKLKTARKHLELATEKYFNARDIKLEPAIEEFQKAVEIMPDNKDGYLGLAQIFIHSDKFDLAIDQLEKAIEIDPCDKEAWNKLWLVYYRMGKLSLAQEALKKYLYLYPADLPKYLLFLQSGFPDCKNFDAFTDLLSNNLQRIIDIAKRRKVGIILQDYPNLPVLIASAIADKNKVIFVQQQLAFSKLAFQENYSRDYFVEDGHCNGKGYAVMAENVYQVLRTDFFNAADAGE